MIDPRDIRDLASSLSLDERVVEKDYVLGWLLAGIANDSQLSQTWIFKGGTCLKKMHFETYRFSEDLDFTLTQSEHLNEQFLLERFREVAVWVYDQSGIRIPSETLRFELYDNPRGGRNGEGRVYYQGPLRPPYNLPKIKLDITPDEVLVLDPERHPAFHPYADDPPDGIWVQSYAYTELFAEKIRALHERARPRDLYDVMNMYRREDARISSPGLRDVLEKKCAFKRIELPTLASVQIHEGQLRATWVSMLGHQLPATPVFEGFWGDLPEFFAWLMEERELVPAVQYPLAAGDDIMRVPLGGYASLGVRNESALERIRSAASNRFCVDLEYVDQQGHHAHRIIEPYSLRRTQAGDIVLHAVRADGGEHRSYRVERIVSARVTDQFFSPRYAIELMPGGFQQIPPTSRSSTLGAQRTSATRPRRQSLSGISYVYECSLCGKRFTRKTRTTRLNSHNGRGGYPCPGRTALFVETRF